MKNKILIGLLLTLAMVFSIGLVNGASVGTVTLTIPPDNSDITGTIIFTATSTYSATGANFSISTDGGATFTIFCNNASAIGLTTYTCSNSTSIITSDSADVRINATIYNTTTTVNQASDTNTGIDIDNTNPTASLSLDKSFISKGYPIFADCSGSTDAVDTALTYLFTLTKSDSSTVTKELANSSSKSWTFSGSDTSPIGFDNTINCTVWDNVGKISSSTVSFDVKSTGDGVVIDEVKKAEEKKKDTSGIWIIIIIVIIVAIVVILYATQSSKPKRRRR